MGKVVKLEPTAKRRPSRAGKPLAARGVGRPASTERRRRRRRDKTALVLGGGGFTGGVYEIGALRALDLLAVNSTVNNFDVYVGTSAGSFIAALCANGVTPEEMMRVVTRQGQLPFKDIEPQRPAAAELHGLPAQGRDDAHSVQSRLHARCSPSPAAMSLMDVFVGLADGLPSGIYNGSGIEGYLHNVLTEPGRTDNFGELDCELYLTATDLDTCERVVFGVQGVGGSEDVPISTAVRASGALPMVYAPGQGRRPRADRRRDRVHHQPRPGDPGGGQAGGRDQPDRPVRQRLHRPRADDARTCARGGSPTWASPRSATRSSSSSPTSAYTNWPRAGSSATRAWTSS